MKFTFRYLILAGLMVAIMLAGVGKAASTVWSGGWAVMGAGGGNTNSGVVLALSGTLGQAVSGISQNSGDVYQVSNGFWSGVEGLPHHLFLPLVLLVE